MPIGTRSSGGALATGGTSSESGGASFATTGGNAPIPVPEAGAGGADPGVSAPSAGESGQASGPAPSAGTTSSGGSMSAAGGSGGGSSTTGGSAPAAGSSGNGGSPAASGGSSSASGAGAGGETSCVVSDEICDGIDNDCDDAIDETPACPTGCQGLIVLERRYVLCEQGRHAVQARELCGDHDMRLSWVESADENNALLAALGKAMGVEPTSTPSDGEGVQVYLGGSDAEDEGHWSWVANGDSVMFWEHYHDGGEAWEGEAVNGLLANWGDNKPNDSESAEQNCLVIMLQNNEDGEAGEWNDVACDEQYAFLCEESYGLSRH